MTDQLQQIRRWLRRDGWLLAALAAAVLLCLLTDSDSNTNAPMTDAEIRAAQIFSAIEGAGKVDVAVYYPANDESGIPCGAVIVADGADDIAVRLRLSQAASSLFGIDTSEIGIFKREEAP